MGVWSECVSVYYVHAWWLRRLEEGLELLMTVDHYVDAGSSGRRAGTLTDEPSFQPCKAYSYTTSKIVSIPFGWIVSMEVIACAAFEL